MQKKVNYLKVPKYMSKRCVLIHVNGVREDLVDNRFFSTIIDFSDLMR